MARQTGIEAVNNAFHFKQRADLLVNFGLLYAEYRDEWCVELARDVALIYEEGRQHLHLSCRELSEIAGLNMKRPDYQAARAAWLLTNIEQLAVVGVHVKAWHKVNDLYKAPLLDQIAHSFNVKNTLCQAGFQRRGCKSSVIDLVGGRGREVWLVQVISDAQVNDSAVVWRSQPSLFPPTVYGDSFFAGPRLATLRSTTQAVTEAFPTLRIRQGCLILHPEGPDFELHDMERATPRGSGLALTCDSLVQSSLDYEEQLQLSDHDCLMTLPSRLDNEYFRGLPPCRGGRAISMLACIAAEQVKHNSIVSMRECEISAAIKQHVGYITPRDKVRGDLLTKLASQSLIRWCDGRYFVTACGLAHYLYCLARFTTCGLETVDEVIAKCMAQQKWIWDEFGRI